MPVAIKAGKTKPFDEIFILSFSWTLQRLHPKVWTLGFMAHTKRRYGVVFSLEDLKDMENSAREADYMST